jgi:hypothetical protein
VASAAGVTGVAIALAPVEGSGRGQEAASSDSPAVRGPALELYVR